MNTESKIEQINLTDEQKITQLQHEVEQLTGMLNTSLSEEQYQLQQALIDSQRAQNLAKKAFNVSLTAEQTQLQQQISSTQEELMSLKRQVGLQAKQAYIEAQEKMAAAKKALVAAGVVVRR